MLHITEEIKIMAETFKSIKELLREYRIYNSLNTNKVPLYEDMDEVLKVEESNLDLDLSPIDYGY